MELHHFGGKAQQVEQESHLLQFQGLSLWWRTFRFQLRALAWVPGSRLMPFHSQGEGAGSAFLEGLHGMDMLMHLVHSWRN